MKYDEFICLLSDARMSKYKKASGGNKVRTIQLYHHNLKLSQRMFGVIGMFEVILRNAIYNHYKEKFSDAEWIVGQASADKLLEHEAGEIFRIKNDFIRRGIYSPDKMVASFSFGFSLDFFSS